jgi:SH3-like domain-containing protein
MQQRRRLHHVSTVKSAQNARYRKSTMLKAAVPTALVRAVLVLAAFALLPAAAARAQQQPAAGQTIGSNSKLPVPRYVSLKSDRVNLRAGPAKDHRTLWVFQRAGLPVEITAEFATWRRIRDSEGTEGWVLHSLLSGRRTALVTPWDRDKGKPATPLLARASENADVKARLEPGVIVSIETCDGAWCRISVRNVQGYLQQGRLWGVYPDEVIE